MTTVRDLREVIDARLPDERVVLGVTEHATLLTGDPELLVAGVHHLSGARSSAQPAGHTDRIVAPGGPTGPSGSVPSGAFLRETLDAHLTRAALGPARQAGSVPFRLSTKRLARIVVAPISSLDSSSSRVRSLRVSGFNTRCDQTAGPTAGLALRVELRSCFSLSCSLLQASTLTKRRADLAPAQLADPPSCMRNRPLLLRCHRGFLGDHLHGTTCFLTRW